MRFITILFLIFFSPTLVFAGPMEEAQAAYESQDYATALRLFQSLADHGDAQAQTKLGQMYLAGKGIKKDTEEALKWYRKAADQGFRLAMYAIASMYSKGIDVNQDDQEAYFWYLLASYYYNQDVVQKTSKLIFTDGLMIKQRDFIKGLLNSKKSAAVDKRIDEWKQTHSNLDAAAKPFPFHQ